MWLSEKGLLWYIEKGLVRVQRKMVTEHEIAAEEQLCQAWVFRDKIKIHRGTLISLWCFWGSPLCFSLWSSVHRNIDAFFLDYILQAVWSYLLNVGIPWSPWKEQCGNALLLMHSTAVLIQHMLFPGHYFCPLGAEQLQITFHWDYCLMGLWIRSLIFPPGFCMEHTKASWLSHPGRLAATHKF